MDLDARFLQGDSPPDVPFNTLAELFQHQSRLAPNAIAFSCRTAAGLENVTYGDADSIARSAAPVNHTTVAVWLEKGVDLVLSILAVTYSGAAWLPLDPDVPVDRARTCINDASADLILCDAAHFERASSLGIEVRLFDRNVDNQSESLSRQSPGRTAYLIYTSGTTGTPKGIAISQKSAVTFAVAERQVLQTCPDDIVWNGFSPAFDMFIEEMWVTIAGGGHLAIGTRQECTDVPNLPCVWAERKVTLVNAVPTLISIMNMTDGTKIPESIRLINLGGEACPPALVDRLARPGLRLLNTYGPTETTVTATWDELEPGRPVTIGRPLPCYNACLLDFEASSLLDLVDGTEGELAIGGPCVGLGYVNRPDLTSAKFVEGPYGRIYRTGDRVIYKSGKLEFHGRIDSQVKHRGFRIELGEIESVMTDHAGVQTAAVILARPGTDMAALEAFVVCSIVPTWNFSGLPAYMRPERIHLVQEMPRLASGKINMKALHDLSMADSKSEDIKDASSDDSDSEHRPQDELSLLLSVLSAVFKKRVTPTSDFFDDLGGHSLLAAIVVSQLRKAKLDQTIPFACIGLPDIYELRIPEKIAAKFAYDSDTSTIAGDEAPDISAISQRRFLLCGLFQIIPLLFLFFLATLDILVPYLLFNYMRYQVGWALLAIYAVFVASPMLKLLIAVSCKWIILGKAQEGEYPIYGLYYFRWWTVSRLLSLVDPKMMADSALYPMVLRALGAKVGKYCHLGVMSVGAACDLVEIGDDVVTGADVVLAVELIERGYLVLRKVKIADRARIGSHTVIEGCVGEGAEVGPLSMVPCSLTVPRYTRFHGSPAVFDRNVSLDSARRPSSVRAINVGLATAILSIFFMPLIYMLPQIPGLLLFNVVNLETSSWTQVAILSVPITFAYQTLIFAQLILLRHLVLPRLAEGEYSIWSVWYMRKWFVDRAMDLALEVLHPVFATLYIVPFLRALGIRIGRRAEVSTARGLTFGLLDIGEECFVADAVMLGDTEVKDNYLKLKATRLEPRAFAGNASLIPQGTTMASGTLVGVMSIAPPDLAEGTSCFGSPPVRMPARQMTKIHNEKLLYRPTAGRIAARLTIEGLRIVLPRAVIVFGIGYGLQIAYTGYQSIGAVYTLLMLPLFHLCLFALPALGLTVALKWLMIGRYRPAEWPLWSLKVWLSEAITSTWETLTEPLLANYLIGTPYLAWCFRLLGVKIGSRATLLSSDITEFDCVTIGNEVMINQHCGAQTHLFEDRVMKVGRVTFDDRSCAKPYSICLPGSRIGRGATLGCLSLVMKGEQLPEGTSWEGAPVVAKAGLHCEDMKSTIKCA